MATEISGEKLDGERMKEFGGRFMQDVGAMMLGNALITLRPLVARTLSLYLIWRY